MKASSDIFSDIEKNIENCEECETLANENLEQLPRFQLIKDASEIVVYDEHKFEHKLDLYRFHIFTYNLPLTSFTLLATSRT